MTFNDTEAFRPARRPADAPRGRLVPMAAVALVAASVLLAACTSSHKNVAADSSAPAASGLSSGPVAPLSSGPAAGSPAASAVPPAVVGSPAPASSQVAPGPPVANVEAPAPKAGFQIRVHRGMLLKVNLPQPKAGSTLAFTLKPGSSTSLKPLAGYDGYFIGTADGVVTVQVSQDGVAAGSLTVTVWG